jgi:hypothetical protein
MTVLERECDRAIVRLYNRICDEVYNPAIFYQMIGKLGALEAAKALLREKNIHSGFTRLCEEKRFDLTIEAFALRNTEFHPLFTEQTLLNARKKLDDLDYREDW